MTFKKATVHPLIAILTSCQGYVSEFFLVSHIDDLALVWPCQIFTLVSYPDGMNLDRIGGWVMVSDRNQTWTAVSKERLFKKKKYLTGPPRCRTIRNSLGLLQKLQEQGAISNRIPSFLITYSLSLEPALFCESKYGWGQPCILCLIFYFIAASEEFIQTLALSLNISVASLSLSADQQCHIRTLLFPKRMTGIEWWCWRKGIKTTGSHSVRTVLDFTAGVCNPALEFARAFFCWGQH